MPGDGLRRKYWRPLPRCPFSRLRFDMVPCRVAAALAIGLVGVSWVAWRATRPVDRPLMRLNVDLGPDALAGQFTTTAISADGVRLVFPIKNPNGKQMLATRLLGEAMPSLLSETENGRDPFFSPDGHWIGFLAEGKLKKIPVQGGAPVTLCEAALMTPAGFKLAVSPPPSDYRRPHC